MNSKGSVGLGAIIAMILSYSVNKSVLWMLLHGLFGWFYVIYHMIKHC